MPAKMSVKKCPFLNNLYINLGRSRDGLRPFVRVEFGWFDSFSSLWVAFMLTVHINALYNESVHRQEQHTRGINKSVQNSDFIAVGIFWVENFHDRCVYDIGLIAIRGVSPVTTIRWRAVDLHSKCVGSWSSKGFHLFAFPANKEHRQLWNSTVNCYRWIPRAGSLKLC